MLLLRVCKAAFIPPSHFYKMSGTEGFQGKTICTSGPHNESSEQLCSHSGSVTETFLTAGMRESAVGTNQGPPLGASVSAPADVCSAPFRLILFFNRCHKLGQTWWRVGLVVASQLTHHVPAVLWFWAVGGSGEPSSASLSYSYGMKTIRISEK